MKYPKNDDEIQDITARTCPEPDCSLVIPSTNSTKLPFVLLFTGCAFILLYLFSTLIDFWGQMSVMHLFVMAGGVPDPAEIQSWLDIRLWAEFFARLSLGIGLILVAISLMLTLRRLMIIVELKSR